MPSVSRLPGVTIYVYASDHAPPHFHVVGPNSNAQVRLDNLQVLRGRITRADYAAAIAWAAEPANAALLRRKWDELNERD